MNDRSEPTPDARVQHALRNSEDRVANLESVLAEAVDWLEELNPRETSGDGPLGDFMGRVAQLLPIRSATPWSLRDEA